MSYTGYSVEEIEDAIVSTLKDNETLKSYVRTFERMPWSRISDLESILKRYPAIIVAYRGGSDDTDNFNVLDHAGMFAVMCANKNVRSPSAAARGPASDEKGVYDMLSDVLNALNYSKLGLDIIICRARGTRAVAATQSLTIFSRDFEVAWRYAYSA